MAAVIELTRDKDGFLKCKDCPRRFLTELMFENHSSNQLTKSELESWHNSTTYDGHDIITTFPLKWHFQPLSH